MDNLRQQIKNPIVIGIVGFALGLILGWFIIGWGLWPVKWINAEPQHLRLDLQEDYLRMAIDSFARNKDAALARSRYQSLGEDAADILQTIEIDPQVMDVTTIGTFKAAVQVGPGPVGMTPGVITPGYPTPGMGGVVATPTKMPFGSTFVRVVFPIICAITLLIAAGLVVLFFLRSRRTPGSGSTYTQPQPATPTEWADYEALSDEPPMVQYMASYKLGDDLFDDSFSIDSPAGEFLGECGVGISDTIGVGDPKKVTAFEVWLFDKNDIQTVTKVLMSDHVFQDDSIRQRLSAKGEPVLAEPGIESVLETQTLRLMARVVDLGYGDGGLPSRSYFDRFVLELAVWMKA